MISEKSLGGVLQSRIRHWLLETGINITFETAESFSSFDKKLRQVCCRDDIDEIAINRSLGDLCGWLQCSDTPKPLLTPLVAKIIVPGLENCVDLLDAFHSLDCLRSFYAFRSSYDQYFQSDLSVIDPLVLEYCENSKTENDKRLVQILKDVARGQLCTSMPEANTDTKNEEEAIEGGARKSTGDKVRRKNKAKITGREWMSVKVEDVAAFENIDIRPTEAKQIDTVNELIKDCMNNISKKGVPSGSDVHENSDGDSECEIVGSDEDLDFFSAPDEIIAFENHIKKLTKEYKSSRGDANILDFQV